jgi:hypothetical protein
MLVLKFINLVLFFSNGNMWTLINLLLTVGKGSIVKYGTLDLFFDYFRHLRHFVNMRVQK